MSKVWFITGASRGFGHHWATAALERGDRVVATARDTKKLEGLASRFGDAVLPLELDVTDRSAAFAAVEKAVSAFGRIDVVVNNAGYGLLGGIEEFDEKQIREQFETNYFGAVWVLQAALPVLREQHSGHIINVSSIGGVVTLPYGGVYASSKWAIEGLTETLAQDVKSMGIKVTIVEPGAFDTGFTSSSVKGTTHPAYQQAKKDLDEVLSGMVFGRPEATSEAILAVVDAAEPPLRIFLGDALPIVSEVYKGRLAEWDAWRSVSKAAAG